MANMNLQEKLPSVVMVTRDREQLNWLTEALDGTAEVVLSQQTELNDVLQLVNMATASIVFIPLTKHTWLEDIRFIEGLVAASPTLACVAVADTIEQDQVLGALRAGAKDFITFAARASEIGGLVRRLAERVPDVIESPMRQGSLVVLASERPVIQAGIHGLHVAASIKKSSPDARVLLVDLGVPLAEAQNIFGLEGQFSFMDALRNLRRLDQILVESAFPLHKSGVRVLSSAPDGLPIGDISTSEMFLLVGTLRSLFTHVVFNTCGLPTVDMTELLIGNANHVIFCVDQSITSCRSGLDFRAHLKQLSVPIADTIVLVDHYLPKISPDSNAIARSFETTRFIELPASPELRMRAINIGQLIFELAPQDVLAKRYRELAALIDDPAVMKAATKPGAGSALGKLKQWIAQG